MRNILILATLSLLTPVSRAQHTDFSKLPAKDIHQNFAVAADAYSNAAQSKQKFGKADPYKAGILAVDVYLRNDTKYPVHVDLNTMRLMIDAPDGKRFHLRPLSLRHTAEDIAHPQGSSAPSPRRFPEIPFPHGDSKQRSIMDKLQLLTFQSDIVPPGGTTHGCLFFDISHHFDLVPYASLYVPDVKSVASNSPLIYFEVSLGQKPAP